MKTPLLVRLLACLVLLAPVAVRAKPALWMVKDADTTIYLFGTVHLLPNDTDWHYPALDKALMDSSALYIEITDDDQANMTALVLRNGIDTTHPLSSLLTPADLTRLDRAARLAGLPGTGSLNIMRPWLAALTLTVAPLMKAGLDPKLGVDKQLRAQMENTGKPVHALETAEEQIHFLSDMPTTMQLDMLRSTLRETDHATVELKALIDAWKNGDDTTIARLENDPMKRQEPALYQRLLVERNETWAGKIKMMLDTPGTVFIAVGAAHLAGPDSVQAQLKKLGVSTTREPSP